MYNEAFHDQNLFKTFSKSGQDLFEGWSRVLQKRSRPSQELLKKLSLKTNNKSSFSNKKSKTRHAKTVTKWANVFSNNKKWNTYSKYSQ